MLETIGSISTYFIDLYTGKQPQCKLGYGKSRQCDSFQLGEMIRHFSRKELLRIQSTIGPDHGQALCTDHIVQILEKLRQCPSYQIDTNHGHCGLRSRLLPLLDHLWPRIEMGICLKCWNKDRRKESWLTNPTGGNWHVPNSSKLESSKDMCRRHAKLKAMFTPEDRIWTPSDP